MVKLKGSWCCCYRSNDNPFRNEATVVQNVVAKTNEIKVSTVTSPIVTQVESKEIRRVYTWSGFRANDEEIQPKLVEVHVPTDIKQVTGTKNEVIFVLNDGSVWVWHRGESADLPSTLAPTRVKFASDVKITSVSSGKQHNLALDDSGSIYSWGSNSCGQLGLGIGIDKNIQFPTIIKLMASKIVVQVATGENHSVVLTQLREIYLCGSNTDGQLGKGTRANYSTVFVPLALFGMPWDFIAAGGNTTIALTVHAIAFGWGDNSHLQLTDIYIDTDGAEIPHVASIRTVARLGFAETCDVVIGKYHVLLKSVGKQNSIGVRGSNKYNQQGPHFDEGVVTQSTVGDYHTLLVGDGNLYCYGPEINETDKDIDQFDQSDPKPVLLPHSVQHFSIFAFDLTSIVIPRNYPTENINCLNSSQKNMISLDEEDAVSFYTKFDHSFVADLALELRFRNLLSDSIWNASFLKHEMELAPLHLDYNRNNIDFNMAESTIKLLWSIKSPELLHLLKERLNAWLDALNAEKYFESDRLGPNPEQLHIIAYLPLFILNSPETQADDPLAFSLQQKYLLKFASGVRKKMDELAYSDNDPATVGSQILDLIYYCYTTEQLERIVAAYKRLIVFSLRLHSSVAIALSYVRESLEVLASIWDRNKLEKRITNYCFMIPQMESLVNFQIEYIDWINYLLKGSGTIHHTNLCDYPFLFDPPLKARLFQFEQKLNQLGITQISRLFEPLVLQSFVLAVNRDNILQDTLEKIKLFEPFDFKKPLHIKFIGEEGQDAGGVKKEFFLILIRQLLDFSLQRGYFQYNEESKLIWFSPAVTTDGEEMDFLLMFGVLCGLAIYNSTIINIPFPLALFKKMLGEKCSIDDLLEVSPTEGRSTKEILEYSDSDFEATFGLNFEVSKSVLGITKTLELKPDGKNIAVTLENKKEFVEAYIDSYFNESVNLAYNQLVKGFNLVLHQSFALRFFTAEELRKIIIGNEDYDWESLQDGCRYEGIFHETHETVQFFWEVFQKLSVTLKKTFLLFLTGNDRVPISGMSHIGILIKSSTDDEGYLPVAHTCFNTLDLPVYKSREKLKEKLLLAIEHKEQFHLA